MERHFPMNRCYRPHRLGARTQVRETAVLWRSIIIDVDQAIALMDREEQERAPIHPLHKWAPLPMWAVAVPPNGLIPPILPYHTRQAFSRTSAASALQ
jgi:hypothetical protein